MTLPGQSATGIQRPIEGFNDFGAKSVETKMPDVDARKKSPLPSVLELDWNEGDYDLTGELSPHCYLCCQHVNRLLLPCRIQSMLRFFF